MSVSDGHDLLLPVEGEDVAVLHALLLGPEPVAGDGGDGGGQVPVADVVVDVSLPGVGGAAAAGPVGRRGLQLLSRDALVLVVRGSPEVV